MSVNQHLKQQRIFISSFMFFHPNLSFGFCSILWAGSRSHYIWPVPSGILSSTKQNQVVESDRHASVLRAIVQFVILCIVPFHIFFPVITIVYQDSIVRYQRAQNCLCAYSQVKHFEHSNYFSAVLIFVILEFIYLNS